MPVEFIGYIGNNNASETIVRRARYSIRPYRDGSEGA